MTRRPPWERHIRNSLPHRGRFRKLAWRGVRKLTGYAFFVGFGCVIMGIFDRWGSAGGAWTGAALGVPVGICGALWGATLMNVLIGNRDLMTWAPAGLAESRRIHMRESVPVLGYWLLAALVIALATAGIRPDMSTAGVFVAAALSFLAGFCFIGGKWSCLLLWLGCAGGFAALLFGDRFFPEGAAPAAFVANAWPPSLAWSAATGLAAWPVAVGIAFALLMVESLLGWRRVWTADIPPPTLEEPAEDNDEVDEGVAHLCGIGPRLPAAEATNAETRGGNWQQILRDRFLTEHQRRLATLGNSNGIWFAGTQRGAFFFTIAACAVLLDRHGSSMALPQRILSLIDSWTIPATMISIFIGFICCWPGRHSALAWMTQPLTQFGSGLLPAFAAFPFSPRDWLGAASREWLLRSLWVGAMLLALLAIILDREAWQTSPAGRIALAGLPWLMLLSLFPLHVIHRVSLATSGAMFRIHGASRTMPSLLLAVTCPAACATAVIATAGRQPGIAIPAFGIALASAALSLRIALARGEGARLDLRG